jgi:hypothetical protein
MVIFLVCPVHDHWYSLTPCAKSVYNGLLRSPGHPKRVVPALWPSARCKPIPTPVDRRLRSQLTLRARSEQVGWTFIRLPRMPFTYLQANQPTGRTPNLRSPRGVSRGVKLLPLRFSARVLPPGWGRAVVTYSQTLIFWHCVAPRFRNIARQVACHGAIARFWPWQQWRRVQSCTSDGPTLYLLASFVKVRLEQIFLSDACQLSTSGRNIAVHPLTCVR